MAEHILHLVIEPLQLIRRVVSRLRNDSANIVAPTPTCRTRTVSSMNPEGLVHVVSLH